MQYIDTQSGAACDAAPLAALLSERASRSPDACALTIDFDSRSFSEVEAEACRIAGLLRTKGIGIGDRLAIILPNSHAFVASIFAAWKLGAIPCPVSPGLMQQERDAILELLGPALVVSEQVPEDDRFVVIRVDEAISSLMEANRQAISPVVSPHMKILHSGGSTGRPKLIVDPNPAVWGSDKMGYRREEAKALSIPGPFFHTSPFMNVLCGIAQGTHVVAMTRFDPHTWLGQIERYKIDQAWLVPTMMARIANLPPAELDQHDISSLDMLVHVAAPCPDSVKRWWIERLGADKVWEIYGGTERIGATFISGEEWLDRPGSVGRANPGHEIVIRDDAGKPVGPGEIGEIWFRRSDRATPTYRYVGANSRAGEGLDTFGDMGWLDEDGYLFIADRRTDMFTVGGENVFPAEIENAISGLDGVLGCAVIGLPDADLGNRIHAIVELPVLDDSGLALNTLGSWIEETLPRGKRPHSLELTHKPLRDEAGKIRRSRLREARLGGAVRR